MLGGMDDRKTDNNLDLITGLCMYNVYVQDTKGGLKRLPIKEK